MSTLDPPYLNQPLKYSSDGDEDIDIPVLGEKIMGIDPKLRIHRQRSGKKVTQRPFTSNDMSNKDQLNVKRSNYGAEADVAQSECNFNKTLPYENESNFNNPDGLSPPLSERPERKMSNCKQEFLDQIKDQLDSDVDHESQSRKSSRQMLNMPMSNYGGEITSIHKPYPRIVNPSPLNKSAKSKMFQSRKGSQAKNESFQEVFNIQNNFETSNLNFSQRRYEGFRGRTEFDKKRILMSGKQKFSIHSFENYMQDEAVVLLE
jgi:hypothetical protein